MLIWSEDRPEDATVLRTCPECHGACYTETATCKRCLGEGAIVGPWAEVEAELARLCPGCHCARCICQAARE